MQYILLLILLFVGAVESIRHRKLTVAGAIGGVFTGFCIFLGAGWYGIAMLALFFLAGTLATGFKRQQKKEMGMMQERGGRRKLGQVLANAGAAGAIGLLSLFLPQYGAVFSLMIAASFSSAMADTVSSELGSLYGKRFYNILTLKEDNRGLDGVVSVEGTLLGFVGSIVIAVIYSIGFGWDSRFFIILLAGTLGNLLDSVLGATLERDQRMSNDVVNFCNTLVAALVAGGIYVFIQS